MGSVGPEYVPPFSVLTDTNRGGELLIVIIVGLIVSVASVSVRIFIASRLNRKTIEVHNDDLLCFAGLAFCAILSALLWASEVQGFGKYISDVSPPDLLKIQRLQYASDIFYVIALFASRASVLLLYRRIHGGHGDIVWKSAVGVLSVLSLVSLFIISLKCDLREPWLQYNVQCTGLLARWQVIEAFNIVIECAIFALGVYLVSLVRMKLFLKIQILLLFATRALVVLLAALRIGSLPSYVNSTNPTYTGIRAAIYAISEVNASLLTATTPLLKSFVIQFGVVSTKPTVVMAASREGRPAPNGFTPVENGSGQPQTDPEKPSVVAHSDRGSRKKRLGGSALSESDGSRADEWSRAGRTGSASSRANTAGS